MVYNSRFSSSSSSNIFQNLKLTKEHISVGMSLEHLESLESPESLENLKNL